MRLAAQLTVAVLSLGLACNREDARKRLRVRSEAKPHSVTIHAPAQLTGVNVGKPSGIGKPVVGSTRVRCETCHSLASRERTATQMKDLTSFHQGLRLEHGKLACASCHLPGPKPSLHLADGRPLPTNEALELCGQCHGPQLRDYRHGSHGGMTGYWDLTLGPRTRNHCVDCHDPHAPAIRSVLPAAPPRDRFFDVHVSSAEPAVDQHSAAKTSANTRVASTSRQRMEKSHASPSRTPPSHPTTPRAAKRPTEESL